MNDKINNLLHELAGSKIENLDQVNDDVMDQSREEIMHDKIVIQGKKIA